MIEYNSFLQQYKTPFGATLPEVAHEFRLKISSTEALQTAELVVYQDEQWVDPVAVLPLQAQEDDFYSAIYYPAQAGLYFYFFKIDTEIGTKYYGCVDGGFGGVGQVYSQREAVQMYQLTCIKQEDSIPKWYQNAVFYHIFVDRFFNGNQDGHVNDPKPNSFIYGTKQDLPYYIKDKDGAIDRWDFYGGNLKGIEVKLPYLKALGITALYLSPIFEARSNHRYDTGDYLKIDGVLGTLAEFEHFLNAAHRLNLHVILDGVFNHVGADSRYFNLYQSYESVGAANGKDSPYADWFTFKEFPKDYESWWGVLDLPAIRKDSQNFHDFIASDEQSVIGTWTKLGIDGWRLDVADELNDDFIFQIRRTLNRYKNKILIGEVWEDASHKISYGKRRHYIEGGGLEAVMNYPLRRLLLDLVNQKIAPRDWVVQLMTLKQNYPETVFNYNFNNIGTHDTQRALTAVAGNQAKLRLLFQLFLTLPGVPCIYYGDEAGVSGDVDPDNRRFFPWGHEDQSLQQFVQNLVHLRRNEPAFQNQAEFALFSGRQWLGYLRTAKQTSRLCLVNPTPNTFTIQGTDWQNSTLTPQQEKAVRQQIAGVKLAPYGFLIFPGIKV